MYNSSILRALGLSSLLALSTFAHDSTAAPEVLPTPEAAAVQDTMAGSWFSPEWGMRINIAHTAGEKPQITAIDYDTMERIDISRVRSHRDGVVSLFMESTSSDASLSLQLLDAGTLGVTAAVRGEPEVMSFSRSQNPGEESSAAEAKTAAGRLARSEAMGFVEGIRAAQLALKGTFGTNLAIETWPRAIEAINSDRVEWEEGSAFDELGWMPGSDVRATYSVELTEDGFTVHAWTDGDDDGIMAHVTATNYQKATLQTDEGIY